MALTVIFQFNNTDKNREIPNEISDEFIKSYEDRLTEPPVQLIEDKIIVDMDNPKLSQWIKNFREYHAWTQSDLTNRSTVSLQYISQIERNTFKPAVGTVRKLLHSFLEEPRQMQFHDFLPEIPVYINPDPVPDDIYNMSSGIIDFRNTSKSKFDIECIKGIIDDTLLQIKSTNDYGLLSFALLCLQLNLKIDEFREYKTTDQGKEEFINRYKNELSLIMMQLLKAKEK